MTQACGKPNRSLSNTWKRQIYLHKIIYIEVNLSRKTANIWKEKTNKQKNSGRKTKHHY